VAFWVRDRLGMILSTLTVLSLGAFVFDPQNVIWNERLVPFWFITIHLSAGWLFGYSSSLLGASRSHRRLGRFSVQIGETRFSLSHGRRGAQPVPVAGQSRRAVDDDFVRQSTAE
jgi:hypothetical protein